MADKRKDLRAIETRIAVKLDGLTACREIMLKVMDQLIQLEIQRDMMLKRNPTWKTYRTKRPSTPTLSRP